MLQVGVPLVGAWQVVSVGGYEHAPLLHVPAPYVRSVVDVVHIGAGGASHATGSDQCKQVSVWLAWQVRTATPSQSVNPICEQSFEHAAAHAPFEQNGVADGHATGGDQS
jgi:hypothetical protein